MNECSYYDSSDPLLHSNWRLEGQDDQQLFYDSAGKRYPATFWPKIAQGRPPEQFSWSDASVHVLLKHSYIYNFGFALFDLYASFKGMHLFDQYDYNKSQLVLLGGCRGHDVQEPVEQNNLELCNRVFSSNGWIRGVSARAAVSLEPLKCYRNAIVGATAVYNLYSLNNDAGYDMREFSRSFLSHYMPAEIPDPEKNVIPRVLVLIRHKMRPDVSDKDGREFFVESQWDFRSMVRIIAATLHIDVDRVTSLDIVTLPLKDQIFAVRSADIIITPDGGISYVLAFARNTTAVLVLSCQYAKDLHQLPYWSFLRAQLNLHCSEQELLVDAIKAVHATWVTNP
jgi:hypothetical protein